MKFRSQGKKVFVGMSGGVDSSVSAALLKEQGYDVTGVFIRVWEPDWMPCTSREDRLDAMRVAAHLDIPLITLNFSDQYKKEVVDYMINEYKEGRTPNPDVMCNKYVKFGAFFDWAMNPPVGGGADYVATGHYSRIAREFPISNFQFPKNENLNIKNLLKIENYKLKIGIDSSKDQSYFLWTLTQKEISKTLFPVGDLKKSEVRKLAKKFKLPNADKKDSQGLCFIGKVDIKEFLSHYIDKKPGKVLSEKGEMVGEHDGAVFYTLGERHGFKITKKTPDGRPLYVIGRDLEKNTITVSEKNPEGNLPIEKKEYLIAKTNWISDMPKKDIVYSARIRHLGELLSCKLESIGSNKAKIIFEKPTIVALGQSIVIYEKDVCLGGGVVNG